MATRRYIRLRPTDVFCRNDPTSPSYQPFLDDDFDEKLEEWLDAHLSDDYDDETFNSVYEDFMRRWREEAIAKGPDAGVIDAYEVLEDEGLLDTFLYSRTGGRTVGDFLLHCPAAFRNVKDDEAYELNRARSAAVRADEVLAKYSAGVLDQSESDAQHQEERSGAQLVLLRPTRITAVDESDWNPESDDPRFSRCEMHLRSGDTIEVEAHIRKSQVIALRRRCWVVVNVKALVDGGKVRYWHELILAVPDNGPLRVSDVHPSLSMALCFDTVCRYLLSGLDLSEESLPDQVAAHEFLNRIHSEGLPPGRMGPDYRDGKRISFRERLLDAMSSTSGRPASSSAAPERRLIKTFRDAENYAAEYMRHLGFADATPTPAGSDGGIDVVASDAVAQVKMEGVATGRPVVQGLFGVATIEGKSSLMFSLAGYTAQALEWADRAGVAWSNDQYLWMSLGVGA